jgi:SAM-dependent methyltransferase
MEADARRVVTEGYDALGHRYYEWTTDVDPPYRQEYIDRLRSRLRPRSRVLELGCGPGLPVARMLSDDQYYVGVDSSIGQLRLARPSAPGGQFVLADMAEVAFVPSAFDAVIAFYSIIHLPRENHLQLFRNISRWLRPSGVFVANLGAHDDPGSYDDWVDGVRMFWSFFDAGTNVQLLEEAGFELARSEVLRNFEDERDVNFLWVEAVRR